MSLTKEIMENYKADGETIKTLMPSTVDYRAYLVLLAEQILGRVNGRLRPIEDLLLLLYHAKRTGLDPLSRQIYMVYRWNTQAQKEVGTIQVGIDGLRAIAERSGEYAGSNDIQYEEKEGLDHPIKATCTVYRAKNGDKMPIVATARWSEYAQYTKKKEGKDRELSPLWKRMPFLMLGKCAEALALRRAFPQELSGLYVDAEITEDRVAELPEPTPKINGKKLEKAKEEAKEKLSQTIKKQEVKKNEN